jgi:diketogulonate reductase-like aldo/keto reductase
MAISATREVHGVSVPSFFYGTAWKEERTEALVAEALKAGFRAIDTANQRKHYFEEGVGKAVAGSLQRGEVTRAELFLQTKFTYPRGQDSRLPYDLKAPVAEQVAQSFASSLKHLQTDYIDSYVLHGPSRSDGLADVDWEAWGAISALQRAGKTKLIGISNVSLEQLVELVEKSDAKPAFVQNRCYAQSGWDREVREFCAAHQIVYQGFSLLTANRRAIAHPVFARIRKRVAGSLEQVVFRFAMQVGMIPLTGTSDASHMREDLGALSIELSPEEVAAIERASPN